MLLGASSEEKTGNGLRRLRTTETGSRLTSNCSTGNSLTGNSLTKKLCPRKKWR